MKLRAGLVGLGMMGRHHARVLATIQEVEFVGSCDPKSENDVYGQGKPIFRSLEELIQKGPDYVVIAVPTLSHLEIGLQLADHGIHVLIEKPLAHNSAASRTLVDVFGEKDLIGAVGHIERFNPAVIEAKNRLETLGMIYQVSTRRQGPFPGRISDVGVIMDLATHDIDITSWVTGQEFISLSAKTASRSGREKEDLLLAVCELSEGTITNHLVNWLSPKKERLIHIMGENGVFEIDTLNADLTYYANGTKKIDWDNLARFRGVSEGPVTRFAFDKKEPLLIEHESFRDAILGRPNSIVTLKEGLKTVFLAEEMLEASKINNVLVMENT